MMNKEDVFKYIKEKQELRTEKHKQDLLEYGECCGLTDKEYTKTSVKLRCKSKVTYTSNRMWKDFNVPK